MIKGNGRKSQLFLMDLITAVVILFLSLGVIFSYFSTTNENLEIYDLNKNLMESFTTIKVNSLNNPEIRRLFILGEIKNIENTVAQQVAEFYSENRVDMARNLSELFFKDYIGGQTNVNVTLSNETKSLVIFSSIKKVKAFEEASITSTSQRTVFGFIDRKTPIGPYYVIIRTWQ